MIHSRSSRLGAHSAVQARKNGTQPTWSTMKPQEAAKVLSPTVASEDKSAYWVAVNSRLHRARVFLRDRIGRHLNVTDAELWRKLDGRVLDVRRYAGSNAA